MQYHAAARGVSPLSPIQRAHCADGTCNTNAQGNLASLGVLWQCCCPAGMEARSPCVRCCEAMLRAPPAGTSVSSTGSTKKNYRCTAIVRGDTQVVDTTSMPPHTVAVQVHYNAVCYIAVRHTETVGDYVAPLVQEACNKTQTERRPNRQTGKRSPKRTDSRKKPESFAG